MGYFQVIPEQKHRCKIHHTDHKKTCSFCLVQLVAEDLLDVVQINMLLRSVQNTQTIRDNIEVFRDYADRELERREAIPMHLR